MRPQQAPKKASQGVAVTVMWWCTMVSSARMLEMSAQTLMVGGYSRLGWVMADMKVGAACMPQAACCWSSWLLSDSSTALILVTKACCSLLAASCVGTLSL